MSHSATGPLRVLGRYALYEEIAAGGMAAVHLGRLLGPVGFSRTVAIKRLHAHYAKDPEFVSMFLDEARLAARIRHPNVVQTLDVVAQDGELFLVMEYVQGDSLHRLLRATVQRGERVPVRFAFAIVGAMLHGLHAAHEARGERGEALSLVHRDVSPQNVLVGVDGVARILDFGVAKAAGRVQTTREGQIKGKMAYMAPEQVRGMKLDRRTDIYAAGVVLWETLTGRRLFEGENDVVVFGKVLAGNAPPPSKFAAGISPEIDALVMRAIALWPADRFETAREMAREMEKLVPLVAPAEVGEWVELTAHDGLAARAEKIARIETESSRPDHDEVEVIASGVSSTASTPAVVSSDEHDGTTQRWTPAQDTRVDETVPTQMSSSSFAVPDRPTSTRRWPLVVAGSVLTIGAITAFTVSQRRAPADLQPALAAPIESIAPAPSSSPRVEVAEQPAAPVDPASRAALPEPGVAAPRVATDAGNPPRATSVRPTKPKLERVLDSRK